MQELAFTTDMALVLLVTAAVTVLFITEWVRVDVAAMMAMVSLPLLGLIDGRAAFAGLSSTAVVSIIAVIILGRGLDHSGVINRAVGPIMRLAGSSRRRTIVLLSLTISIISSFMQNVGAAALFLPALKRISRQGGVPLPQLLMPVAFAAILGGTITLVGSSPLIMLNDLLRPFGLEPFNLFAVTPLGLALVGAGIGYFLLFGEKILPGGERAQEDESASGCPMAFYPELDGPYELQCPAAMEPMQIARLCNTFNVHTVAMAESPRHKLLPPDRGMPIPAGATIAVYGTREHVARLCEETGLTFKPGLDVFKEDLSSSVSGVLEAVVPPHSAFAGRTLGEVRLRHNQLLTPLAIAREHTTLYTNLMDVTLEPGMTLLVHGAWERFQSMRPRRDLLFVQRPTTEFAAPRKAVAAVACFVLSTLLVLFSGLNLAVCLMTGALGMVLTRVLTIDEAYRGVDWRTVFLLGGLIPLGTAMQQTGAASWLAQHILGLLGQPPVIVFYLVLGVLATVLTLVVSNVGAAVLLVPLAVDMAHQCGADPRMAALVVGLAASNSFLLPTHQVNALYMGPGKYTTMDFLKAGLPMTVLFLVVLTLLVWIVS
ncbi:MAG: SLC13 family permease [Desulfovibrionaceae bacterium]